MTSLKTLQQKAESYILRQTGDRKEIGADMKNQFRAQIEADMKDLESELEDLRHQKELIELQIQEHAPHTNPKPSEIKQAQFDVMRAEKALNAKFESLEQELDVMLIEMATRRESVKSLFKAKIQYSSRNMTAKKVAEEVRALEQAQTKLANLKRDMRSEQLEAQLKTVENSIKETEAVIREFSSVTGAETSN